MPVVALAVASVAPRACRPPSGRWVGVPPMGSHFGPLDNLAGLVGCCPSIQVFCHRMWIDYRQRSRLALALDLAGFTPTPVLLPTEACLIQDPPDRRGAHMGQAIGGLAKRLFEQRERPGSCAIRLMP